jgi:hypothetical protein
MTAAVAVREVRDEETSEVAKPAAAVLPMTSLGRWAYEAREASQIAVSLAKTPFVPASLRDRDQSITAANVTAAILTGQELGLEPMAALRSIDVIQGTPAMRAMAMRAIVLAHGHDLWVVESTETRAIVRGQRRGSEHVQESTWTLDRATKLGLAGKENWRKQPAAMLIARATSECARLIAPDAMLGVPYSIEEIDDGGFDEARQASMATPRKAPAKRTAQRKSAEQPPAQHRPEVKTDTTQPNRGPEPEFDEPAAAPTQQSPESPELISQAQQRKMFALFKELGIEDRDERLADVAAFLGHDVASTNDVTKEEAIRLIDDLERRISGLVPEDANALFGGAP